MSPSPANFPNFQIARLPRIVFGSGALEGLPQHIQHYGHKLLLVTGARSFLQTPHWAALKTGLKALDIAWTQVQVSGEPSPQLVDEIVAAQYQQDFDVVVGIGGGSVLDAAKAIAGLLPHGNSVLDHLEGVGRGVPFPGVATPFIAVPTTAGTGSEATKNAVLSHQGADGYKKSFRDDALVAQIALIDPELLSSCPSELIAANGMDAFTQLLEAYVSTRANPMTDALAWSGMEAFSEGFFSVWEKPAAEEAAWARSRLAYASLQSGICLAQTGLGSVHGLASPLGAFFPIPHGVVCGTLLAEATDINITALKARLPDSPALAKYTQVARLLCQNPNASLDDLVALLREWTTRLKLPRLSEFGMSAPDFDKVVANSRGSSMKTNPLVLEDAELRDLLQRRL